MRLGSGGILWWVRGEVKRKEYRCRFSEDVSREFEVIVEREAERTGVGCPVARL